MTLLLIPLGAVVSLLRIPLWQWDGLWAEDGSVFWAGAINPAGLYGLAEPYAGYFHVVPRILALALSHSVPQPAIGLSFTITAALVVSALGVYSGSVVGRCLRTPWLGLLIWLGFVLVPIGMVEGLGNLANLHWYLLAAMCITILTRFGGRGSHAIGLIVVAATILSDPLAFIFLPWLVLRFVVVKERWRMALPIVAASATTLQITGIIVSPLEGSHRALNSASPAPDGLLQWFTTHVLEADTIGLALTNSTGPQPLWLATTLALLFVAVVVAVALCLPSVRWRTLALVTSAVALGLVDVIIGWQPEATRIDALSRYAIGPALILGMALISALDALTRNRRAVSRSLTGVLLVAIAVSVYAIDFRQWKPREDVPTFSSQMTLAHASCRSTPNSDVVIQLAPKGWTATIGCHFFVDP